MSQSMGSNWTYRHNYGCSRNAFATLSINNEQLTDNGKVDLGLDHLAPLPQNVVSTPTVSPVLAQDAAIDINCQMTDSSLENKEHKVSPDD